MAGIVRGTPDEVANKWATRLSGATAEITAGIDRVTVAPGVQAAAKADKWLAAVTQSQEKWKRNVARVSLDTWKTLFKQVGVQRIGQGAQAKKGKFADFAKDFFPHLERGLAQLAQMPDLTYEQRVAKAVAMMNHNHSFKRSTTTM